MLASRSDDRLSKRFYFDSTAVVNVVSMDGAHTVQGQLACRFDTSCKRQVRRLSKAKGNILGPFQIRDHDKDIESLS
jgi:hypothetical protein